MKKFLIFIILFSFCFQTFKVVKAESIASRLSGCILLQVESNGEAWYINPVNQIRYYLGRPDDAFGLMRDLGIGITNSNLNKIPVGLNEFSGKDSDGDGLSDDLESALGTNSRNKDSDNDGINDKEEILNRYNSLGKGKQAVDLNFSNQQKGKIFLQVENNGEAWYVNPKDGKRYFLGRPNDAFSIMRNLGLGINNNDIAKIRINTENYSEEETVFLRKVEQDIHNLINIERNKEGLASLSWNEDLAQVAREHSENLARENIDLTKTKLTCDFPFIHHEGFDFGLYHSDRLINRSIYYFSQSAENIALVSRLSYVVSFDSYQSEYNDATNCNYRRNAFNKTFDEALKVEEDAEKKVLIIKTEIDKRREVLKDEKELKVVKENWIDEEELAKETVNGWMNSAGHRANILNGNYNQAGLGVSYVNGYVIATQVFIKHIY